MPLDIAETPCTGTGKGLRRAGVELGGGSLLGELVGVVEGLVKPLVVPKRFFLSLGTCSRAVSEEAPTDFVLVKSTLTKFH